MRPEEFDEILGTVTAALQDYANMNAHEQLRKQINAIHSDLNMRGIHSKAIEDATYAIETLSRAYMEPAIPIDWRRTYLLSPMESSVAEILYKRMGQSISVKSLLESAYSDRPRHYEELNDPEKLMQVFICRMRKMLKASPFSIETDHCNGYRMVLKPSALALTALQELQAH